MEDYFGYDGNNLVLIYNSSSLIHFIIVFMVMNITDIDDKIIIRARRNHLFDVYRAQHNAVTDEVIKDLLEAWNSYIGKLEKKLVELKVS